MANIPPPIMTSGSETFPYYTVRQRLPAVIDRVVQVNEFPGDAEDALRRLREEVAEDRLVAPLVEDAADIPQWRAWWSPYAGHTWLDIPWYFAEAYFYRRLLEATRYFAPGPQQYADPFKAQKDAELEGDDGALAGLARALGRLPQDAEGRLSALLLFNLWGNRADLTFASMAQTAYAGLDRDHTSALLIDHRAHVWQALAGGRRRVDFINDNAGLELLFDLALANYLLERQLVQEARFHLKPYPFFVSDAMTSDVRHAIGRMKGHSALGELGERLEEAIEGRRLTLCEDAFWISPLGFTQMPTRLKEELGQADLVFVKGDANYRRLLDDRAWPPTASLAGLTAYFPSDYVAIRTVKAELIVDLDAVEFERLGAADAGWMVSGHYGLIQHVRVPGGGSTRPARRRKS